MYRRLTVARLKELCDSRCIACDTLRYKRDYVQALQKYDASNDGIRNGGDNESESNAACARQEETSDVEESDEESGDGGFLGDDNEVTLNNPPHARVEGEPEEVVLLRLRPVSYTHLTLPTNREV